MTQETDPALATNLFLGRRVMVVEDSPTQRAHAVSLVQEMGGEGILEAGDGLQALAHLEACPDIDLVLCDLEMPSMDGVAFIGEMASRGYRPDLVIVSILEPGILRAVKLMAMSFGLSVTGIIPKPLTAGGLVRIITGPPFWRKVRGKASAASKAALTGADIREGILRSEFVCYFQPQITFKGAMLKGVEALVRWRHPEFGLLGPAAFLPQAEEEPDLMSDLTLYLLDFVSAQWHTWKARGMTVEVSMNLSAKSVSQPGFADRILARAEELGLPPRSLVFEMTESASVSNLGQTLANLVRLKMRGFGLSIDDFGTGFATFEQLERIPFNELKIDQSITRELPGSERHLILARNMLKMAKDLDLNTVAEGIETQESWDVLKSMGCDRGQGYFLGRPMPGDQLREWLTQGREHLR